MRPEDAVAVEHLTNLLFLIDRKAGNVEEVRMLATLAKRSLQQLQSAATEAVRAERARQQGRMVVRHAA